MRLDAMYQEMILDHYQQPAPQRAAGAVRRRGAPRQPDLRRRGHAAGAAQAGRRQPVADISYDGMGCSISQAAPRS